MKIYKNISLKSYNTFKIDALASYFIDIENPSDLIDFYNSEYAKIVPRLFLGGGSNILFTSDYKGLILHSSLQNIEIVYEDLDETWIKAGSGLEWDKFVEFCVSQNLGGLENLSDIPGNVGSAPVQNIGAYGVEAKDSIISVETFDIKTGSFIPLSTVDCHFGYRSSVFKEAAFSNHFITHVIFRLKKKPIIVSTYGTVEQELGKYTDRSIQTMRKVIKNIRQSKLPVELGSAGSFFKNPVLSKIIADKIKVNFPNLSYHEQTNELVKIPAAWLIENSGLKGFKIGDVGTYEKQPLVIVNYGKATGLEIVEFSKIIQQKVFEAFGIMLEPEVCII